MTDFDPQPGDWVLIKAEVVRAGFVGECAITLPTRSGPEEIWVKLDVVAQIIEKPIPDEPAEGSVGLLNVTPGPVAFQRLADGHWYSAGEVGRADGLTWVQLQALGDVEVIHDA